MTESKAVVFPVLEGVIAQRGIKKKAIATAINVTPRALSEKLNGNSKFYFDECSTIRRQFFPDMGLEQLFSRETPTS